MAQQRATAEPVRVHAATQPTFTRYIFAIPANTSVSNDRVKERLTLTFDAPIKFDLADVVASLPRAIGGIDTELRDDSALVRFNFLAKVDVRTFRDDGSYVLDVVGADNKPDEAGAAPAAPAMPQQSAAPETTAPATVPPAAANDAARAPSAPGAGSGNAGKTRRSRHPQQSPRRNNPQRADAAGRCGASGAASIAGRSQPAAKPKVEAQIAAPETPPQPAPSAEPAKAAPPRRRQHRRQRNATRPPRLTKLPANDAPPPRPRAADSERQGRRRARPPGRQPETVVSVRDGNGGSGLQPRRHALDRVRFRCRHRSRCARRRSQPAPSAAPNSPTRPTPTSSASNSIIRVWPPSISTASTWTVQIGDSAIDTTRALSITRNLIGPNRSSVSIPFDAPHLVHRLDDPDAGDTLMVVTAFPPARGFINERDFVEFRALASAEGVVVEPLADDVKVELAPDKIIVSRPMGLALSTSSQTLLRGSGLRPAMFDSQLWGFDQQASYTERQSKLVAAAAVGARQQAPGAAARSRPLLCRPRHVSGGQGRARRRARRRARGLGAGLRGRAARGDRDHDEPARRRAEGSRRSVDRRSARCAAVAGARLCQAGQMGAGARRLQGRRCRGGDAAGRIAARRAQGRDALGHRSRRFLHRFEPAQRFPDHRRAARARAGDGGADRPARRRHGPQRGRARRLSDGSRTRGTGAPRRRANCARPCCATRSAISSATTSFRSSRR